MASLVGLSSSDVYPPDEQAGQGSRLGPAKRILAIGALLEKYQVQLGLGECVVSSQSGDDTTQEAVVSGGGYPPGAGSAGSPASPSVG